VLAARPSRRLGQNQIYSDYIMFLLAKATSALQDATKIDLEPISEAAKTDLKVAKEYIHDEKNISSALGNLPSKAVPVGSQSEVAIALARSVNFIFVSFNLDFAHIFKQQQRIACATKSYQNLRS